MIENAGAPQQFTTITYVTKDGEKCTATKNNGIVTVQGDKNGVRQVPLDDFMKELAVTLPKVDLARTPNKDTVQFKGGEEKTIPDAKEEAKPNHTVRNWSIGLGSVAALIGLGIAGRRGHLGSGLQKLLGGAEKDAGKLADDLAGAAEHTNPHVSTSAEEISAEEFSQIVNREADFVYGGTKAGEEAASKAGAKAEAPKAEAPHTPKVEYSGAPITKEEIKAINDSLEKGLPKVTEDLLRFDMSKIPTADTYEKVIFDTLKIPKTGVANSKQTFTYEGKEAIAHFGEDCKLRKVEFESLNGEKIDIDLGRDTKIYDTYKPNSDIGICFYYGKNQPVSWCFEKNGHAFWYGRNGSIVFSEFQNAEGKVVKNIDYIPGTSSIKQIRYYKTPNDFMSTQKVEKFEDGKLIEEIFYKEPGKSNTISVLTYS